MTTSSPFIKPRIPPEFTQKSTLESLLYLLYALALFFLPAAGACYLLLYAEGAWLWRLPLGSLLILLAGQGMHVFGWVGHEGLHFNLHENKIVSALMGLLVSGIPITFFEMGMAINHWAHHRYTNTMDDPDIARLAAHKTLWARLFQYRSHANSAFFRSTLLMAFAQPLPAELQKAPLPVSAHALQGLAIANLLINLGWLLVLLALWAHFGWQVVLIGFLLPMIVASILSAIRSYVEHIATGNTALDNTRTRSSGLWTVLEAGANFHHEHHLFPGVPQWRLPRLHRLLKEQGVISQHTDASHFAHWKLVGSAYGYTHVRQGEAALEAAEAETA